MFRRPTHFLRDTHGNVAVILGVSVLPVMLLCGTAIDYSNSLEVRSALQAATDGTAITLCQTAATTTADQMREQAKTTLHSYSPVKTATVDPVKISTTSPRLITLTTRMTVSANFGGVTGRSEIPVAATSTCATPVPRTFEIALVLDNTASMEKAGGSGTKMQAAKDAATNFVTYISTNPSFSSSTRIALVPFAGSVAVDPTTYRYATWIDQKGVSSYGWRNFRDGGDSGFGNRFDYFDKLKAAYSDWSWKGCFDALPYPLNVQDVVPVATNSNSYYVPALAPDEPGEGRTKYAKDKWNQYTYNTYIADSTTEDSCKNDPAYKTDAANETAALGRSCKYRKPTDVTPNTDPNADLPIGPNFTCTSKPLTRLTTDFAKIKTGITAMTSAGQTNIHDGLMWGWRVLSPISVFADGTAYKKTDVTKVMVLMTDGMNTWKANPYNTVLGSLPSQFGYYKNADGTTPAAYFPPKTPAVKSEATARDAIDAITLEGCTAAKAAGVTIYTIGFSVSSDPIDQDGISLLASCAGPSKVDLAPPAGPYAYVSNDSSSLISAFAQIGNSIGALRLTR